MTKTGTLLPFRSKYFSRIEAAAIDAWVGGKAFTARSLCDEIAAATDTHVKRVEVNFWRCVAALRKRGMYVPQPSRIGSKGVGAGSSPTSPHIFNFTAPRVDVERATLYNVAQTYLSASDVEDRAKSDLRSALRFHLGMPTKCSDEALLRACMAIPCSALYGLPQELYRKATALPRPVAEKSAKNFRACVRAAMRHAAAARAVPIVFPRFVEEDEWSRWLDEYFPLSRQGSTDSQTARRRQGWRDLAQACKKVHGADFVPARLTRELAAAAIDHLEYVEGRGHARAFISQALRSLAADHQTGPWAVALPEGAFQVSTPRGLQPAMYLRGLDGMVGGKSWERFVEIVRENGFPPSMIEYLEYYGKYITLPARELLTKRSEYPRRRASHYLSETSLTQRGVALRLFLGVAKAGIDPAELTPDVAFGTRFEEIASAVIEWWQARRDTLAEGQRGTAIGGLLKETIISAGMMAYTLYERQRHRRKAVIATRQTGKTELLDARREEAVAKDPMEQAAWDAYNESGAIADVLDAMARDETGAADVGSPEIKDIRRVVENTPPAWWIALLNHVLSEWRAEKRAGRDQTWTYHKRVLLAFELGAYISTGCRNEELCLASLEVHARDLRNKRLISFGASDRKNDKPHSVLLQHVYVPDDLLAEYLDRSRPYFMRDHHMAKGRPESVKSHEYLLVNTTGAGYPVVGTGVAAKGAQERAFAERVGSHGRFMKLAMAAAAVRAGLTLPRHKWEFGLHCIRGACGYGIYVLKGRQAAAHYLGDSESTAESAYAAIDGKLVDSSALVAVDMTPQLSITPASGASRSAGVADQDYAAQLDRVLERWERGTITEAEAQAARAALRARFGIGQEAERLRAG